MWTLIPVLLLMFAGQNEILHRAPVEYPQAALAKGIQGSVTVEVNVDEEGLVTDAHVVDGPAELRAAALRSVLDWHFSKQMHLPAVTQVSVDFKLPDGAGRAVAPVKPLYKPNIAEQPVQRINIQGLNDTARQTLLSRLPVREGEMINADLFDRITTEVQSFDEHLRVMLIHQSGGVTVDIAPKPPQRFYSQAGQAPGPLRVGGNAQQAKLVRKVQPVYPPDAKASGIQGLVRLTAIIGKDGEIKSLNAEDGPATLVTAAMDAVKQWTYEPTKLNGEPVEVITQIDVNFTLSK